MKILVIGSSSFIGKNLIAHLESPIYKDNIIYKYDIDLSPAYLENFTKDCEFVYFLAEDKNYNLFELLLTLLEENKNNSPVVLISCLQWLQESEHLERYKAEEVLLNHSVKVNSMAAIYRLPYLFGKWAETDKSVIASFCYNIARNLEIEVYDRNCCLHFYYIDDLITSLLGQLEGKETPDFDGFYRLPSSLLYDVTIGELEALIKSFHLMRTNNEIPYTADPFIKKLYSTYLSYLPETDFNYSLTAHKDERGSFTEVFKSTQIGQISVNVAKPGVVKGGHYHHTKCEKFLVVNGKALMQFRKVDSNEIINYFVSSDFPEIIDIPVGYIHTIKNIGDEDLVTLIWANEIFDSEKPDTYTLPIAIYNKNDTSKESSK